MDGTGDMFAPLVSALPKTVNPIVVSYPADQELNFDALAVLGKEAIPESGSYALLGESFSGPIAIKLASEADSRLTALFLCCSFARNPSMILAAIRPILSIVPVKSALTDSAAAYLLGANSQELKDAVHASLQKVSAGVIRQRMRELVRMDVTKELRSVTAPIQYLQAIQDRLVPIRCAQRICDVLPSTEVYRIDGPHLLLQTEPERSSQAIIGFLQRTGAI